MVRELKQTVIPTNTLGVLSMTRKRLLPEKKLKWTFLKKENNILANLKKIKCKEKENPYIKMERVMLETFIRIIRMELVSMTIIMTVETSILVNF